MAKHTKRRSSTKTALIASFAALLLCSGCLVGSTYAWFTDTATTGANVVQAGELNVDLQVFKDGEYVSVEKEDGTKLSLFGSESDIAQDKSEDTLWEPGKTQVVYLAIANKGNLALKYNVILDTINPENGKKLYEVMQYKIVPDAKDEEGKRVSKEEWNEATAQDVDTIGQKVVSAQEVSIAPKETHYFALAVHMKTTANNEHMGGSVQFGLAVNAVQDNKESDSFGKDYDKITMVSTGEDLVKAVKDAKTNPTTILLSNDIVLDGSNNNRVTVGTNQNIILDLNGKKITTTTVDGTQNPQAPIYVGGGLNDGTTGGKLTIRGNGTIDSREGYTYTVRATQNSQLIIENGTFIGSGKGGIRKDNNATITIYDGSFSLLNQKERYAVLFQEPDTLNQNAITVFGGTFLNTNPTQVANGATTAKYIMNYVPDGYTVQGKTENGNTWYTVIKDTNS